jgi:foldase protein PrsA
MDLVLAPQVRASTEEVRAYYNSHREEFQRPDQVLAQHALLPTRKLAQALVTRVEAGEDMARASAMLGAPLVDGGEPMWLSRGHMPQELEDKVFATRPGSLAGPLASPYGFHVVRVVAKRAAGVTQLIDAAEDIQRKLSAGKMEAKASAWTQELRSQAEIRFDPQFEATGKSAGASRR